MAASAPQKLLLIPQTCSRAAVRRLGLWSSSFSVGRSALGEAIDVFRAFFPVGDVLEHEDHLLRIFAKPFRAKPRLIPIALWPFDRGLHESNGIRSI